MSSGSSCLTYPGRQGPPPCGGPGSVGPLQLLTPSCPGWRVVGSQGVSTCGCFSPAGSMGPPGLPRSRLPPLRRPLAAGAPRSLGPQLCSPGQLIPHSAGGSSCGSLTPVALLSRRLVVTRVPACLRRLRCLTSLPPIAGLPGVSPCRGPAGWTSIGGPGQRWRSCCQTWCSVSSLRRRATRAALFSSVALHSSSAH